MVVPFILQADPAATRDIIYITGFLMFLFFTILGFRMKEGGIVLLGGIIGIVFGLWLIITYEDAMIGLMVIGPALVISLLGVLNMWEDYA